MIDSSDCNLGSIVGGEVVLMLARHMAQMNRHCQQGSAGVTVGKGQQRTDRLGVMIWDP